jgi:hypothetical protein
LRIVADRVGAPTSARLVAEPSGGFRRCHHRLSGRAAPEPASSTEGGARESAPSKVRGTFLTSAISASWLCRPTLKAAAALSGSRLSSLSRLRATASSQPGQPRPATDATPRSCRERGRPRAQWAHFGFPGLCSSPGRTFLTRFRRESSVCPRRCWRGLTLAAQRREDARRCIRETHQLVAGNGLASDDRSL